MKAVVDRIVQYANRYQLTNVETGEVLGTFDFDEVTGTVQQVGTEIDAELFQSIADDLAARVVSNGGELKDTVVTFTDLTGTASNVASGDKTSTLWSKVKNWFSRLKALAFKDKISNADVANDANIVQSKIDGLRTEQNGVQIGTAAVCTGAGAAVGSSSRATSGGGAVGYNARATSGGGAVGVNASAQNGGAVGSGASAQNGGAVGSGASATSGGAVGNNAKATTGGAVGNNAKATEDGAVQLGSGTNDKANTLQFRGYQIVDANGNIPAERLSANSPVRSVNGKTGAVTLVKSDVGLGNVDNTSDLNKPVSNAVKAELDKIKNGTTVVGAAESDEDGNNIVATYAKQNGSYLTLGAGYLANGTTISSGSSGAGWHKFMQVSNLRVSNGYSAILLVNGVLHTNDNTNPNSEHSGIIEIYYYNTYNTGATYYAVNVLAGNLTPEDFCLTVSGNSISIYKKLEQYQIVKFVEFSVVANGADTEYMDELQSSTPSGAVYAVVRNNATNAQDSARLGGVLAEDYALLANLAQNYTGFTLAPECTNANVIVTIEEKMVTVFFSYIEDKSNHSGNTIMNLPKSAESFTSKVYIPSDNVVLNGAMGSGGATFRVNAYNYNGKLVFGFFRYTKR